MKKHKIVKLSLLVVAVLGLATGLGLRYNEEQYHPEKSHTVPEKSHIEPAITHTVYHPAVVEKGDCIRANINYDYIGVCTTGRCADGTYTGTPHVTYYKTCNYHGGVVAYGPFYYPDRVISAAWTEVVVDNRNAKLLMSQQKLS